MLARNHLGSMMSRETTYSFWAIDGAPTSFRKSILEGNSARTNSYGSRKNVETVEFLNHQNSVIFSKVPIVVVHMDKLNVLSDVWSHQLVPSKCARRIEKRCNCDIPMEHALHIGWSRNGLPKPS